MHSTTLGSLTYRELEAAEWITVGSAAELGGPDDQLTVLLVRHDPDRNRYLALRTRADRVDWTELMGPATMKQRARVPVVVGSPTSHHAAPLDVVYTWVDSSDPVWRSQYLRHSRGHVLHNASAANDERYVDRAELRYSLRSLWMFAPFVRHIYLVTANQSPDWLQPHPMITVIPHSEIFPESTSLPTFNSHAIEACLHRISGLSENFLYFNDDVFLGRETDESDFFTHAGLAKARLSPSAYIYRGQPELSAIPTDWAAYNSVRLIERDFGITFTRRLRHVPFSLKRSVLDEIERRYPDEVRRTRDSRFRSKDDVALPSMLAQYFAMATHRGVEWPHIQGDYVYLNTGRSDSSARYRQILDTRPLFFCLNVTRDDDICLAEQGRQVRGFMRSVFPAPAPWEGTVDAGESPA